MSHIECPHCTTRNHDTSFGCGGPFGGHSHYTICIDCDRTLECVMDLEGQEDEYAGFQEKVDAAIAAQFIPGGNPIQRQRTVVGKMYFTYAPHIPGTLGAKS